MNLSDSHFILINPTSSIGKSERKIKRLLKEFELAGLNYEYRISQNIEAYYAFVFEALAQGHKSIITVGGDGSMHHTVNAVLKTKTIDHATIKLGLISCGTGNDWIKSHLLPRSYEKMVRILNKNTSEVDNTDSCCICMDSNNSKQLYKCNGCSFISHTICIVQAINHAGLKCPQCKRVYEE